MLLTAWSSNMSAIGDGHLRQQSAQDDDDGETMVLSVVEFSGEESRNCPDRDMVADDVMTRLV